MVGLKIIRNKITSIKNTKKITKTMEMVAASKMKNSQKLMLSTKLYANKIYEIIKNINNSNININHPLFVNNKNKNIGFIIITTDKGLCGSINTNLIRICINKFNKLKKNKKSIKITLIGNKGFNFFKKTKYKILSKLIYYGNTPNINDLINKIKIQIDMYSLNKLSSIYLSYTKFINTIKQKPIIKKILPLKKKKYIYNKYYIYEPNKIEIIDELFRRYIETTIYKAITENIASEQSARMIAMKSASDNSESILNDLKLMYNKNRQELITKELSEIISCTEN